MYVVIQYFVLFVCIQLNGFKYSYQTLIILFIIICLLTVKWFQVLHFNISNSVYQGFLSIINNLQGIIVCFQVTFKIVLRK